jgi:myosin heavy subunit
VAWRSKFLIFIIDIEQVFFRAGVLGQMEEFRDERLSRIMSWMQAWARGYLNRKTFKKLQEQRMALTVVQRSLRRYLKLRTWPWWKLWQKVKPLLNASRVEDQIAVSIYCLRKNSSSMRNFMRFISFHTSYKLLQFHVELELFLIFPSQIFVEKFMQL